MFIAIIEDHAGLREAIAALLDAAGYPSRGFESAEAFLRSHENGEAACLVLDERLPGIDGLELQHQLAGAGRRLPIIFISAHEDAGTGVPARALQEGALAFLRKPFNDIEFLDVIGTAWREGVRPIPRYT
ncbi:MAG TPA: response regulator [Burkholderiales bacterium]|jgi:FixJ family two-component response regulator|nr:response regulator [Burkholderiales bacterium]